MNFICSGKIPGLLVILIAVLAGSCTGFSKSSTKGLFEDHFDCKAYKVSSESLTDPELLPDPERDFIKKFNVKTDAPANTNKLCSDQNPNPPLTTIRSEEIIHIDNSEIYLPVRRNPWPGCKECGFISTGYIKAGFKNGSISGFKPVSKSYDGLKSIDIAKDGTIIGISTASKQLLNAIFYLKAGDTVPFEILVPYADIYPYKVYFLKNIFSLPGGKIALCVLDRDTEYWEIHIFNSELKPIRNIKDKPQNPAPDLYKEIQSTIGQMLKHNRTYPSDAFYPDRFQELFPSIPGKLSLADIGKAKNKWYMEFLDKKRYKYFPKKERQVTVSPLSLPGLRRKDWEKKSAGYSELLRERNALIKDIAESENEKITSEKHEIRKKALDSVNKDIFWAVVNGANPGVLFTYDSSGKIFIQSGISTVGLLYNPEDDSTQYIYDEENKDEACFIRDKNCDKNLAYEKIISRLNNIVIDKNKLEWNKFIKKWQLFLSINVNKSGLFARQRFSDEDGFSIDVFDEKLKPVAGNIHTDMKLLTDPGSKSDSFFFLKEADKKNKSQFEQPDYEILECNFKRKE